MTDWTAAPHPGLADAHARAAEAPQSFARVPDDEVARIRPGWFIKVCIRFDPNRRLSDVAVPPVRAALAQRDGAANVDRMAGERFWIRVDSVGPEGFVGTINNALVYTDKHGLREGDRLKIEARHLYDAIPP